jgi:hypothetical protein
LSELLKLIKSPKTKTFRRAKIKRRDAVTGLFESDWLDISTDVKSYGKVKSEIDPARLFKFSFSNAKLVMANDEGKYNPDDNEASLWNGYLNQQRTLVRIEAGYIKHSLGSSGQWVIHEYPHGALWDEAIFDDEYSFDEAEDNVMFTGLISGDINLSDKNEVVFNIKPLTSVFQEFPAKNLTGWTSTGMTASQFITMVRDQVDGSGTYIFRPFFGDTTAYWDISTTSNVYSNLNTAGAAEVIDKTVWDIIEKLAEAENYVPYISKSGSFRFVSRASNTTTVAYEFHGAGSFDTEYGQTIKTVQSYARKISKYYSDVQVKFRDEDTSTSYVTVESTLTVSGGNNPWVLGKKVLSIENFYIPNTATASTIATTLFNEYSDLKNEITFTTNFIPHLDLLDRVSLHYDPSEVRTGSLWDQNNWAPDSGALSTDLTWDASSGDSIKLQGAEFNFLSIEIDLDNFQNTFIAREV